MISPSDNPPLDDRDDFDALISSAMVDVPAVDGLESRILERLSQSITCDDSSSNETELKPTIAIDHLQSKRVQRRWVLGLASSAAALLVMAAAIIPMLNFAAMPQIQVTKLESLINTFDAKTLAEMKPFPGETPIVWPSGRWRNQLKKSKPSELLIKADDNETVQAAFAETTIHVNGKTVSCRVVIIPAGNIAELPSATNVASGANKYHKNYVTTCWIENDHVYVVACNNIADLELLQDYAFSGAV